MFKPILAKNAEPKQIKFPCIVSPKIDGVRSLCYNGKLVGRSLKPHANKYITRLYSEQIYNGLDGEMIVGSNPVSPSLCRDTTSALNTIEFEPLITWCIFDCFISPHLEYKNRLGQLCDIVQRLQHPNIQILMPEFCENAEQFNTIHNRYLSEGYEGIIVRNPDSMYKFGRSTLKEQSLLKIKKFADDEGTVVDFIREYTNTNEAQVNELGLQFRSSHKENKIPCDKIGSLLVQPLKGGPVMKIGPGCLTHAEREFYYHNFDTHMKGKIVTYRHLDYGVKDKVRQGTFKCFRSPNDMS